MRATWEACAPSCTETRIASSWSRESSDCGTHAKKSVLASKPEFEEEVERGRQLLEKSTGATCGDHGVGWWWRWWPLE